MKTRLSLGVMAALLTLAGCMNQELGRQDLIGLTFNAKGQACQWSYRGFYGMQKSKQSC